MAHLKTEIIRKILLRGSSIVISADISLKIDAPSSYHTVGITFCIGANW